MVMMMMMIMIVASRSRGPSLMAVTVALSPPTRIRPEMGEIGGSSEKERERKRKMRNFPHSIKAHIKRRKNKISLNTSSF
jgi:hypothetical protein